MVSLLALIVINLVMIMVLILTQSDQNIESRTEREEKILREFLKEKK
jgi:hypothetical protein